VRRVPSHAHDSVRHVHHALNVAQRRAGGIVPACDGPECSVCAALVAACPRPSTEEIQEGHTRMDKAANPETPLTATARRDPSTCAEHHSAAWYPGETCLLCGAVRPAARSRSVSARGERQQPMAYNVLEVFKPLPPDEAALWRAYADGDPEDHKPCPHR
jgi:hypothetical protein